MTYEAKTKTREDICALIKSIDPKAKMDGKEYDVLANFKPKFVNHKNYIESLELALKIVKALTKMPHLRAGLVEDKTTDFQFEGPGCSVFVEVGREGVSLFLMEDEPQLTSRRSSRPG